MTDIIEVDRLSKTFRFPTIPKRATVKDFVIRTMRFDRNVATVDALKDVSFCVERGSMLGIIGRNGSGKTTLLRIMAGILHSDRGSVSIKGSVAPLLALGTGFHPDLTGREGVRIELLSLGLHPRKIVSLLDAIVDFAEIGQFADAPVRTYSQGMLMRLAFSVAIAIDPDVLLIDEILAVGDEAFARKCHACLNDFRERGKTIVVVTHDAGMVENRCDVALWLDQGEVAGFGDPRAVVNAYHALTMDYATEALSKPLQAPEASLLNAVN
jgi:ABC-type polysaccharide/polyol phosphate transport system ATPase subunit